MSLLNLPGSVCGCGAPLGLPRPLPAPVWVGDTRGTPSPAGPGSVHVTGRAVFLSLACHPGQAAGVDSGEPSSAEEPLPRPGRPLLNPPGAGARRPARFRRRRRRRQGAGAGGWGGVRARSANLGATKPQTAKLGSPGVRPSPDPPPTLAAPPLAASPVPSPPPEPSLPSPAAAAPLAKT